MQRTVAKEYFDGAASARVVNGCFDTMRVTFRHQYCGSETPIQIDVVVRSDASAREMVKALNGLAASAESTLGAAYREMEEGSSDRLLRALTYRLDQHARETGEVQGPVETLTRLLDELTCARTERRA